MIDVTALAESYFRQSGLAKEDRAKIIAAFEAGYLTHHHGCCEEVSPTTTPDAVSA